MLHIVIPCMRRKHGCTHYIQGVTGGVAVAGGTIQSIEKKQLKDYMI